MKAVIFAGGVGTRLWPLSRKHTPKQFEKVIGEKSTLQLAYDRISPIFKPGDVYISSGARYAEILRTQLPEIPGGNFILEPEMRDVGAAVGLVAAILDRVSSKDPFIILWSDHLVKNEVLFRKILETAGKILNDEPEKIVFIGQKSRIATQNLGWIEYGQKIREVEGLSIYGFESLHYRPTLEQAEGLILEKLTPQDGYVIGADFGWSDIGAWEQLKEALSASEEENVTRGKVMLQDSTDSLVFSHTEQMVVGIDLKEFLVINTEDVVLVCPKNSVPKIKKLVESLAGTEHEKLT